MKNDDDIDILVQTPPSGIFSPNKTADIIKTHSDILSQRAGQDFNESER